VRLTSGAGADDHPDWSPDGKWIAFHSASAPPRESINIFKVRSDGSQLTQLTFFNGKNYSPRWSPDGRKLAYVTDRFWPGTDICVWDLEKKLESCPLRGAEQYSRPAWSPDGESLGYSYGIGPRSAVAFLRLKDKREERLPYPGGAAFDLAWSPDGRHAAYTAEALGKDAQCTIQLYTLENGSAAPLISSPRPLRFLRWSRASALALEAARSRNHAQP